MERKSYSQITVQEIIDGADIGRSTFYAHFPTKDDLLRELCQELFDHVFSSHPEMEETHDFSPCDGDLPGAVTHMLYHLRDHQRMLLELLNGESAALFLSLFQRDLYQRFSRYLPQTSENRSGIPRALQISHMSAAFVNLIRWWKQEGLETAPESLTDYFLRLTGLTELAKTRTGSVDRYGIQ